MSIIQGPKIKALVKRESPGPFFVIGPERGFVQRERELLLERGFAPLKVSDTTLRVEHAAFFGLAQWESFIAWEASKGREKHQQNLYR